MPLRAQHLLDAGCWMLGAILGGIIALMLKSFF